MRNKLVLTDDLIREALLRRMRHSPSPTLLPRIVAAAAATPQQRARGDRLDGGRLVGLRAFAGAAAVAVAAVLVVLSIRPLLPSGGSPSPLATPSATPSVATGATPAAAEVGGHAGLRLPLGPGTDPIDVIFADGSIWTANIHADDIRRFNPTTMAEEARIRVPAGQGPAWFTATEGALWVSNQLGGGLDLIDTVSNTFTGIVGTGPTCGAPEQAFGSIWQSACDADIFLRIDPRTRAVETIPARGHSFIVLVGSRLVTVTANSLATLDPGTHAIEPLGIVIDGYRQILESEGKSIWALTDAGVLRIDPDDGRTLATFPYGTAGSISFAGERAWLTVPFVGIVEIDLATNEEVRTIPLKVPDPVVAREAAGALWVTDLAASTLWRIDP